MAAIYVSWVISAAVLIGLGIVVGLVTTSRVDGILIDHRGRYSLTHLQTVLWTIAIISLISGIFFGRLVDGVADPLGIQLPAQALGVFGISLGSAVVTTAVKRSKDVTTPARISASGGANYPPRLAQMFLVEEGTFANEAVDVTKFQGFAVNIFLVIAYVALAAYEINAAGTAAAVAALPQLNLSLLTLLGISHGAYFIGKLPTSSGSPSGLVMSERNSEPGVFRVLKRSASAPLPQ